ncbi:MAG: hypothetical protein APR54_04565 [Candidatus Cloacimonas sp. SDB]|nr:MAG: hypothetical protein APR54_04565 [Candidatus Cloacimonas sp. SDB]
MKNLFIVNLIIILIFPVASYTLTLEEAIQKGLENNPELLAQEQSTKSTKLGYWQSLLNLIPSAKLTGNYTVYDDPTQIGSNYIDESRSYGYSVTQAIFNGGSIWLGSRLSHDQYKISQENLKNQRLNTITEIKIKYFSVLENKALWEIARKRLQNSRTNLEIAEMQYESGTLSQADYLNLQAETAGNEVSFLQFQNLYEISLMDLTNYLQLEKLDAIEEITIDEYEFILHYLREKELAELETIISDIMEIGLENNPNLKISALGVASSKKNLIMAGGNLLPSVNLQYSRNWLKYDFNDDYNSNGQLGINFSLPIFPLCDNGMQVSRANFDLKQAKYNLVSAENNIELALRSSLLNLITSAKIVYSADLAKQYAMETYLQMQERFTSNLISSNDLLSAEIMYSSAQNQYISSFYDFLRAEAALMQQMGIETENILIKYIK